MSTKNIIILCFVLVIGMILFGFIYFNTNIFNKYEKNYSKLNNSSLQCTKLNNYYKYRYDDNSGMYEIYDNRDSLVTMITDERDLEEYKNKEDIANTVIGYDEISDDEYKKGLPEEEIE